MKTLPRRLPYVVRKELEEELNKLMQIGCVEPSSSPYASPLVLVRKKEGGLRVCVDYRNINQNTVLDRYPIPRIDELVDMMGRNKPKVFSSLDLMRGYHQVRMADDSKQKTAFTCYLGLFQYCRMPFGLTNAPATFQRLMSQLFSGKEWYFVFVYLDDILIASGDISEHVTHVKRVLSRLKEAGLRLKPSKCKFATTTIQYLGHTLTPAGVQPNEAKITAVKEFPRPQSVKQVKSFLGLANFYCRHIPNMAALSRPLTNLTRKENLQRFVWSPECTAAFEEIKERLATAPLLHPPNMDKEFFLWTDASAKGFGAVLEQEGTEGVRHPIAYASRATNSAEQKYAPTELEVAALIFALEHFQVYLLGSKVTVFTDHQALVSSFLPYLKSQTKGLLARWYLRLAPYLPNICLKYKPGPANQAADALSRAPHGGQVLHMELEAAGDAMKQIQATQREDQQLRNLMDYLEHQTLPEDSAVAKQVLGQAQKGYYILDGVLYFEDSVVPGRRRIVVPTQLRKKLLLENHEAVFAGHFAPKKLMQRVSQYYYWPQMKADIYKVCESCVTCLSTQGQERCPRPPLKSIAVGEPFECIGMDFKEFDVSDGGNRYALVFQDYLTKWPEVYPVTDRKAPTVARCLADLVWRHGVPSRIIHDRASEFLSDVLQDTAAILGLQQLPTSGGHPQTDGQVERLNRTLKAMLTKLVEKKGRNWDTLLGPVLMAYRTTPQVSTGESPFYLLYGRDAKLPTALDFYTPKVKSLTIESEYGRELFQEMKRIRDVVKQRIKKSQKAQKDQYDKHVKESKIKTGDLVMLKVEPTFKLDRTFRGPYRVHDVTPTCASIQPD